MVHFGSFSLTGFILVHFGSFWFILDHFTNWIHTIFERIAIQKTRKYFIGTKIPIVLQNLFKMIEKYSEFQKKINLCTKNFSSVGKKFS